MRNSELEVRLSKITTLFLDVDGVFTDGSIVYGTAGEELKFFNVMDGLAITILPYANIRPVIVTGRESNMVNLRFKELKVKDVFQGITNKEKFIHDFIQSNQLEKHQTAFMGDDLQDLIAFGLVSVSCAPNNATDSVKSASSCVTQRAGGFGAVREFCEIIFAAQGHCILDLYRKSITK